MEPEQEKGKRRNTEMIVISYVFIALFLSLAAYLIWFNIARRTGINKNVNNTKQEAVSTNVIRGSILTENGEQLAYSEVDYTGNETRIYPYGSLFAHVVGYASNGRSGLEASENSTLQKSSSSLLKQLKDTAKSEKRRGDNLIVSLNAALQQAAWNALGSYNGAVIVMEPDSGKILAMVSKPDFDPNSIPELWDSMVDEKTGGSTLLNRATQGLYPPGSTFKILTTLAYLREHPEDYQNFSYNCTGYLQGDEITIQCYNGEAHGQENLEQAFAYSCNTAFASIGTGLDVSDFRRTAEQFLFNHSLPVDEIPYSQSEFSLNRDSTADEKMTTAFGQGDTLVTPLHMALITSTVANGGIMMKPYLVSAVQSFDGETVSTAKPEIYDQLMTVDESQTLTKYMQDVVTEGTGAGLSYENFSVAGKTGSAEYESNGTTGTHSWFTGFSNVDDPDIVVTVLAEDGGTGSSTAVPIAQQIFEAYYTYVK